MRITDCAFKRLAAWVVLVGIFVFGVVGQGKATGYRIVNTSETSSAQCTHVVGVKDASYTIDPQLCAHNVVSFPRSQYRIAFDPKHFYGTAFKGEFFLKNRNQRSISRDKFGISGRENFCFHASYMSSTRSYIETDKSDINAILMNKFVNNMKISCNYIWPVFDKKQLSREFFLPSSDFQGFVHSISLPIAQASKPFGRIPKGKSEKSNSESRNNGYFVSIGCNNVINARNNRKPQKASFLFIVGSMFLIVLLKELCAELISRRYRRTKNQSRNEPNKR